MDAPTDAPTDVPIQAPTEEPTEAPTMPPTEAKIEAFMVETPIMNAAYKNSTYVNTSKLTNPFSTEPQHCLLLQSPTMVLPTCLPTSIPTTSADEEPTMTPTRSLTNNV